MLSLKEGIIIRQKWLNRLAFITTVLMIGLMIVSYRNNRQKKRVNQLLEQKVKERTGELEQRYLALQQTHQAQTDRVLKTFNDIKSPLNTMKSLCLRAQEELQDPEAQVYVKQFSATAKLLANVVSALTRKEN